MVDFPKIEAAIKEKAVAALEQSEFEGKNLNVIVADLSAAKQNYLYLRLLGLGKRETFRIINRKYYKDEVWREKDPLFAAVEEYVTENKNIQRYRAEAAQLFIATLGAKTLMLVDTLIEKGNDWESLNPQDKRIVADMATMIWKTIRQVDDTEPHHSYEELIMKLRRVD